MYMNDRADAESKKRRPHCAARLQNCSRNGLGSFTNVRERERTHVYGPTSYSCTVPSLADSTYGLLVLSTSHLHAQHHSHSVAATLGHIEQW